MRVAVMGVGGMGGFFGARLAQAGLDVVLIARGEHLAAIRAQNGLQLRSAYGDFLAGGVTATDDPGSAGPCDAVLFCVKTYDAGTAADAMRPLIGDQTVIIPTLNGIDHMRMLADRFGADHVLGGVATVSAIRSAPGVIQHNGKLQRLEFGEVAGGISDRAQAIFEAWTPAGLDLHAQPNIMERMWWKLAFIGAAAVFSVTRGSKAQVWHVPEVRELARAASAEAVAVARSLGVSLPDATADDCVALMDSFPPGYKPSMLSDLEAGRRLELSALNASISRLGQQLGVQTPVNDFITAVLLPYADGAPSG